jgi:hypothetical protein
MESPVTIYHRGMVMTPSDMVQVAALATRARGLTVKWSR